MSPCRGPRVYSGAECKLLLYFSVQYSKVGPHVPLLYIPCKLTIQTSEYSACEACTFLTDLCACAGSIHRQNNVTILTITYRRIQERPPRGSCQNGRRPSETRRQRLFTLDEARELVLMDSASLSSCSGDTGSTSEDSDSDANSTEPVLTQTKQTSQAGGSSNTRHARQRSRDFECRPRPTRGRGQGLEERAARGLTRDYALVLV